MIRMFALADKYDFTVLADECYCEIYDDEPPLGALQAAQAQGQLGATEQKAGLENLQALTGLGATQRDIEQQGITAEKAAFEEARLNPYKMVQFQQSLLSGLPLAAQTYNLAPTNNLSQFMGGLSTVSDLLAKLGQAGNTATK